MIQSNFNEICPHCHRRVYDIAAIFSNRDYQTNFNLECPHCAKGIEVNVHMVPEFEFSKAKTEEEYQARRHAMIERQKQ